MPVPEEVYGEQGMIAQQPRVHGRLPTRIVITGIGLTAPNANDLATFRDALLQGRSGVQPYEIRYFGKTVAGICDFDACRYQSRRDVRRGTRAGSIGIYCAHEALQDAGIELSQRDPSRIGVYVGVTEHGNVETENEIFQIKGYDYDTAFWSHHHNPANGRQQSSRRNCLELGYHGSPLHDWRVPALRATQA